MASFDRDPIFVALTRPQLFAGVTYSFFVLNCILATELFLLFRTAWVLVVAIVMHLIGVALCAREPRYLDLLLAKARHCPRVRNYAIWQCNSYRP
ncbi:MAG TPA: VirB3 family type IV secretion system protein [Sphingobium sp.]